MTYYQEAKDLYEAFQDALGNWERIPFERLTTREMEVWQSAAGFTIRLQDQIDDAEERARDLKYELELAEEGKVEAEEELAGALRTIDILKAFKIGRTFCVGECR